MTLHSQNDFSIPEETRRVARAAYPKGNIAMKMESIQNQVLRCNLKRLRSGGGFLKRIITETGKSETTPVSELLRQMASSSEKNGLMSTQK